MSDEMFNLKQVSTGNILIEVRDQSLVFETIIDDFNDDLQNFADFVASLITGDYPAVYVSDHKNCLWAYDGDNNFKLHCEFDPNGRDLLSEISLKTNRSDLINALHGLAKDIAFHENFARGYLFFAGGTPEQDKFFDVVEREWKDGVKAGLFPDDIDLKDAYEDRRFIEEFPLIEYENGILEKYQNILLNIFPKG
ncbi:hypothetical protein P8H26_11010 [Pseudochrobactrum sp. sp1633]|uniref:hypothetical protein n=1 Tax=Pseudochrobactrum sp. sp1633 TaxID=3036706 RepID=UPI0025A5BDD9|nr:hypothetical protein [Pseudochrobactrum sp. sp1633]MDM8345924.1 hypothetical protein [Pseudochrobactrum sp. sp1633]